MKKLNILFIMIQMEMGGAERLVYDLVRKIDRNLFSPSVAWFFGERALKEFKELDIPLYYIPKNKRMDISAIRKIGDVIGKNNIDIINAHHFMPLVYSFYGAKIKNRASLVYTEHSEWEIEHIPWKWKIIGHHVLKRSDAAVGVSSHVSNRIREKFKTAQAKTFTILNGVSLGAPNNQNNNAAFRKDLGLAAEDKVIGVVANFRRVKNHIFLLKALSEIIEDFNNVKLLLIGQGFEFDPDNTEKDIRKFVNDRGLNNNVLMLGYRSDIPELLNIMNIFCLISIKEGLPISLIEAMSAGLPVIGSDVEGIRDVIIPNKNGFLVGLDDIDGLKKSLLTLLKNEMLCRKMGDESKSMTISTYSLDRCVVQYQQLFMSTIKDHNN